jgi:hypothetical protein
MPTIPQDSSLIGSIETDETKWLTNSTAPGQPTMHKDHNDQYRTLLKPSNIGVYGALGNCFL